MIQPTGEVVPRMRGDVRRERIGPLIRATIAPGSVVYADEDDIDHRLSERGYVHRTVSHAAGEYARDGAGDGPGGVHVNAPEGLRSLPRSWPRPHRGSSQEELPLYLGCFELVYNVRRRGKALLGALVGLLLKPSPETPDEPSEQATHGRKGWFREGGRCGSSCDRPRPSVGAGPGPSALSGGVR